MMLWMSAMALLGDIIISSPMHAVLNAQAGMTTVEAFAYARRSLKLWDIIRMHLTVAFDGRPAIQWLFPWREIFSRLSGE
jgi:hypothetical protein